MEDAYSLAGRVLLAMPGMGDQRFDHAVIAMCVHDEDGALGIGIGQVHPELSFHELLDNVGVGAGVAPDCPVHIGGPVALERGFVLHSPEWHDEETVQVDGRFALSASLEVLRSIAAGEGPRRWLFALGYAGWGPGQLDAEMRVHGWSAADAGEEILFATPAEQRWTASWKAQGIDPALLASATGTA